MREPALEVLVVNGVGCRRGVGVASALAGLGQGARVFRGGGGVDMRVSSCRSAVLGRGGGGVVQNREIPQCLQASSNWFGGQFARGVGCRVVCGSYARLGQRICQSWIVSLNTNNGTNSGPSSSPTQRARWYIASMWLDWFVLRLVNFLLCTTPVGCAASNSV
jgi:hypothetical protein